MLPVDPATPAPHTSTHAKLGAGPATLPIPLTNSRLPHFYTFRRELHSLLDLPMDRPSLRLGCALTWPQQQGGPAGGAGAAAGGGGGGGSQQERLQDVHAGLPPPGEARACCLRI